MTTVQALPRGVLYEHDETAWLETMAELIRLGRLDEIDYPNLAEYLADMARRDRREVESRLTVLIVHALKWAYQPDRRSGSWKATIIEQRQELEGLVSRGVLRNHAEAVLADAYYKAVERAAAETGAASRDLPRWLPVYPRPTAIRRPLYGVMPNEAMQRRWKSPEQVDALIKLREGVRCREQAEETSRYSGEFKATAVKLSSLSGVLIQDVARELDIHPFMLSCWRNEVREGKIVAKKKKLAWIPRPQRSLRLRKLSAHMCFERGAYAFKESEPVLFGTKAEVFGASPTLRDHYHS